MKQYYNLRARDYPLKPGEEVLVLHLAGPKGISAQWIGQYTEEEQLSQVSYRLATPGDSRHPGRSHKCSTEITSNAL